MALNKIAIANLLPGAGPIPPTESVQAFITQQCRDGLTAHGGGGQTDARLITAPISRFSEVALPGDSALLPAAVPGVVLYVINDAANSMNVFPASGEEINALGADTAFALATGLGIFVCAVSGKWRAIAA